MNLDRFSEIVQNTCYLDTNRPLVVGVSGGPDSLCLLDSLHRLGFRLIVAHFDHRLRPESGKDAEVVRSMAEKQGSVFVLGSQDVAAYADQQKLSIEAAARALRYQFLFDQARQVQAQAVAVGHTADDQVETVLMHLLRGSGLGGLTGMAFHSFNPTWNANIPLVRPLLSFRRTEILAYCEAHGLNPVFDPTNQDPTYFRNRLRHELIPYLESYNPQVREALWRMAQVLAGDAAIVQAEVESAWKICLVEVRKDWVALNLADVRALSPGLQRGVLRRAAACLLPNLVDLDFAAIQRAEQYLARAHAAGSIDLVHGLRLWIEGDRLMISGQSELSRDPGWPQLSPADVIELRIPGRISFGSGWQLSAERLASEGAPDFNAFSDHRWHAWLDADAIGSVVTVRVSQPGDRFQPLGMHGRTQKLSDFWINAGLPRRARAGWPLVCSGAVVAWAPGFRPAHPFRITPETKAILHLHLKQDTK